MLAALWCLVGALVVLWWPRAKVRYRLERLAPTVPVRGRSSAGRWLALAPVVGGAVGGLSIGISLGILVALWMWLRRRSSRQSAERREIADLLTALAAVTAELSIGAPPASAFACAADEFAEHDTAVGATMRQIAGRAALGGGPSIGTRIGRSSIANEWHRIGVAWEIAHRYGVPIRDLLESVRSDVSVRRSFAARTDAGLAGPRATAAVLALLPLLGIVLGQAVGARPLAVLCGGGIGGILLTVGTGLGATGLWWSLRIADHVVAQH